MRTAFKEVLSCSAAEMALGTTLRLPGQFVETTPQINDICPSDYIRELSHVMQALKPSPPKLSKHPVFVDQRLRDCSHIFLRVDAVQPPLQPPYEGPYCVVSRNEKTMVINRKGKQETVAIDRVKPAFLDASEWGHDSNPPPATLASESADRRPTANASTSQTLGAASVANTPDPAAEEGSSWQSSGESTDAEDDDDYRPPPGSVTPRDDQGYSGSPDATRLRSLRSARRTQVTFPTDPVATAHIFHRWDPSSRTSRYAPEPRHL